MFRYEISPALSHCCQRAKVCGLSTYTNPGYSANIKAVMRPDMQYHDEVKQPPLWLCTCVMQQVVALSARSLHRIMLGCMATYIPSKS